MKTTLIQTGPNTWAVQYAEPTPPPVRRPVKAAAPKRRKRYLVQEPTFGFRPNHKRYATADAAEQARVCFDAREKARFGAAHTWTHVTAVR